MSMLIYYESCTGPPYESRDTAIPTKSVERHEDESPPKTLHQSLRRSGRMSENFQQGLYLPGLGVVQDYIPTQLSKRPQRQAKVTFDNAPINPVSVSVEGISPPIGQEGGKCEYMQMKGTGVGDNCMKGGMSCERKCQHNTSPQECQTDFTVSRFLLLFIL